MPEFQLYETHALGGRKPLVESLGRIAIREITGRSLVSVTARQGRADRVVRAVAARHGVTLPVPGQSASASDLTFVWMGPQQWFADAPRDAVPDLEAELRASLGDDASLTDQSDSWIRIGLCGDRLHRVLEKLCMVDLHPDHFVPGSAVRSVMEHLGVVILRPEEGDDFELWSARSSARSLHAALRHAAGAVAA